MSLLNRQVLVLNKLWLPIETVPAIDAFGKLWCKKASVVSPKDYCVYDWDSWVEKSIDAEENVVHTGSEKILIPEVIVLSRFDKEFRKTLRLTKKNIYIRDGYVCQYTGKTLKRSEANIDHVVPTTRGGKDSWENMVVCNKDLNGRKGDRTIEEMGLRLIRQPFKPSYDSLVIDPKIKAPESWSNFMRKKKH
jgi:5-methylcytosine-specific restriction endonuclease McrA